MKRKKENRRRKVKEKIQKVRRKRRKKKEVEAQMIKKNIGQFSGFLWSEKEEEKQRARTKEKLDKCIKEKLVFFCDVLDIPINKSNMKKKNLLSKFLNFWNPQRQ